MAIDEKPTIFSADEIAFMRNGEIFERKEDITKRIRSLLNELQGAIKIQLHPEDFYAPPGTDFSQGQLVRGERFHERPFVYLDFPKFFSRQAMFAYRSFFWWGRDFVFSLILSGPHLDIYKQNLLAHLERYAEKGYYISLAGDPWEWRKDCPETLSLASHDRKTLAPVLSQLSFLKIQYFIPLNHRFWTEGGLVEEGVRIFKNFAPIITK